MADRQPVAGMGERRHIDGKAAVVVAQDLARAEAVASGGVLDRVAVGVDQAQRPVARRRRARSNCDRDSVDRAGARRCRRARRASGPRRARAESRRCAPARRACRGRLRASPPWRRRATRRSSRRRTAGRRGSIPLAATPSARPIAPAASALTTIVTSGSPAPARRRTLTGRGAKIASSTREVKRDARAKRRRRGRWRCRRRRRTRNAGPARCAVLLGRAREVADLEDDVRRLRR